MGHDNRIPNVIRDFAGQPAARSVLSFLAFEDWLAGKETEAKDWIVVARSSRDDTTDLFTFSALATVTEDSLKGFCQNTVGRLTSHSDIPPSILMEQKGSLITIQE